MENIPLESIVDVVPLVNEAISNHIADDVSSQAIEVGACKIFMRYASIFEATTQNENKRFYYFLVLSPTCQIVVSFYSDNFAHGLKTASDIALEYTKQFKSLETKIYENYADAKNLEQSLRGS